MIVLKLELHSARTGKVTELGRTVIFNEGDSATPKRGNYGVAVCRKGSTDWRKPLRTGSVKDYPRLSYNVWRLVVRALRSAFPEEG